jgi:hypothetical protein
VTKDKIIELQTKHIELLQLALNEAVECLEAYGGQSTNSDLALECLDEIEEIMDNISKLSVD